MIVINRTRFKEWIGALTLRESYVFKGYKWEYLGKIRDGNVWDYVYLLTHIRTGDQNKHGMRSSDGSEHAMLINYFAKKIINFQITLHKKFGIHD